MSGYTDGRIAWPARMLEQARIRHAARRAGSAPEAARIAGRTAGYMLRKDLHGACYALSCAMWIALREEGLDPVLRLGACACGDGPDPGVPFDHGWIVLDGKPLDVAIAMPAGNPGWERGPVAAGVDLDTGRPCRVAYGVPKPPGADIEAILAMGFGRYCDWFPRERDGIWTVAAMIIGRGARADRLRRKYVGADPFRTA